MILYMTRLTLKLTVLLALMVGLISSTIAQNVIFKCNGIYQTSERGIRVFVVKNKTTKPSNDSKTMDINSQKNEGNSLIKEVIETPNSYLVDTIPIVCFDDFKTVKLVQQKGNINKNELLIELNENVIDKFKSATYQNIGKPLPIIFENKLISAPVAVFTIDNGKIQVTGLDEELIDRIIKKVNK